MNGLKLTGLWKNTSKEGKGYLSGSLGGVKVLVFPNEHKRDEKDPDYNLVLTPREDKEKPAAAAPPSGGFSF